MVIPQVSQLTAQQKEVLKLHMWNHNLTPLDPEELEDSDLQRILDFLREAVILFQ